MMELQVILDFACCACQEPVSVTVKCAGKGLANAGRCVATVPVPCPTCHAVNQLYFEPNGTVRAVTPVAGPRPLTRSSLAAADVPIEPGSQRLEVRIHVTWALR